jgi:hypothetical protein
MGVGWVLESTAMIGGILPVKRRRTFRWRWQARTAQIARFVLYLMPHAWPTWAVVIDTRHQQSPVA